MLLLLDKDHFKLKFYVTNALMWVMQQATIDEWE